jgi:hypothetical protein
MALLPTPRRSQHPEASRLLLQEPSHPKMTLFLLIFRRRELSGSS